jgi:HicB family
MMPLWYHDGAMDLMPYVENIQRQLAVTAEAGGEEARALAERLFGPLDATVRLTLQDALAAAVDEITCELAPGSVELRLRGRDPEFVVTLPPYPALGDEHDASADEPPEACWPLASGGPADLPVHEDGGVSRINLRLPDQMKARVETAAAREGVSINSWLVRAAAVALERSDPGRAPARRAPQGGRRFTGWVR